MKLALALLCAGLAGAADPVSFTIAGLQMMPEPWNKEANYAKLERYARQAAAQGAQVVVTPEGFLEGYVGNRGRTKDLTWERYAAAGERLDGPLLTRVRNLARELRVYLLIGFAELRDDRMYNSAVIFSPEGAVVTHYSKTHTADDEPLNTKGVEFPVASTPLGRWGTLICMDRQLPETSRVLAVKGAQIILVPAYGMYGETNDILMRVRAYENGVWVAFVHPKRCLFIDPAGKIVAQNQGETDQIVTATIRLDGRVGGGPIRHRRPELYGDVIRP
jgi:predicted amidohydrolase